MSVCIKWLKVPFHVLLTATPIFNSLCDFCGLQEFLLLIENNLLFDELNVGHEVNPFSANDDDPSASL